MCYWLFVCVCVRLSGLCHLVTTRGGGRDSWNQKPVSWFVNTNVLLINRSTRSKTNKHTNINKIQMFIWLYCLQIRVLLTQLVRGEAEWWMVKWMNEWERSDIFKYCKCKSKKKNSKSIFNIKLLYFIILLIFFLYNKKKTNSSSFWLALSNHAALWESFSLSCKMKRVNRRATDQNKLLTF